MFSSDFSKIFAAAALAFSFCSSGCRLGQSPGPENPPAAGAAELKSGIPFSAREPEVFQAEIVVTTPEGRERRTFTARSGTRRRVDYDFASPRQLTTLQTDKNYLLLPAKKIYAEDGQTAAGAAPDEFAESLTVEWLSAKADAAFEKLGAENNLTKYRAALGGAGAASEVLITVDEALGFPVRQEFYAVSGGQRTLNLTVEVRGAKLEADESLFAVPADFKKVSAAQLRKEVGRDE